MGVSDKLGEGVPRITDAEINILGSLVTAEVSKLISAPHLPWEFYDSILHFMGACVLEISCRALASSL